MIDLDKFKIKTNKKKAIQSFFGFLIIFAIGFRLTPYLFPITEKDIAKESFHSVKFYDRNGKLLQEVLSENSSRSIHTDLNKVSSYFIKAIIASEDKNFYRHAGSV